MEFDEKTIINVVTQIGVIPALFAYTLVKVKGSLDANTRIMTKLYEKLGGQNVE
ncbi:hypothetical protein [Bacillus sp. ISL-57]|uniref:hypothetical protein n=1 Tax=Bacillus sp. ISL-57 TaxID=2819135 RepID=UPI001BEB5970|nr:hypothetical protein [Bacillus sp. ISL-57]MBT2718074.1 hypothetical protein [Bacillus sp. ISL-57]